MAYDKSVWIHETASVHPGAIIGPNTKVWQSSVILEGARVGARCMIGRNCYVESRAVVGNGVKLKSSIDVWDLVTIEDDVFVGPSVVFTNDLTPRAADPKGGKLVPTLIKQGASLGANATILCGITIGEYAAVGAGALVLRDVPPYALMVGNPARQIAWVCACNAWSKLTFANNESSCEHCRKHYTFIEGVVSRKAT